MAKKNTTAMSQGATQLNAETLLSQAIEKNVPVETMEKLLAMRRELKAEWAKSQFDQAMADFQANCPTIQKTKEVKTDGGVVAYRFAPIESIIEQVKAPLKKYGFSYKSEMALSPDGSQVTVTVKVTHESGHSESTNMTVPLGGQTRVMSATQVVAAATTFAKRYAFQNAFGIMTGDEDIDGNTKSLTVTPPIVYPVPNSIRQPNAAPAEIKMITRPQRKLIESMVTKHREDGEHYATIEEFEMASGMDVDKLTAKGASVLIEKLMARIKEIDDNRKQAEEA